MATKLPVPTEDSEQVTFVAYLEMRGLKFSAIPNSTYSEHMAVKVRNRRMGVRPGVPDMVILLPGVGTAWVELKRTKGGKVSPFQQEWIEAINGCPGSEAKVCRGASEAIAFIQELYPESLYPPDLSF